MARLLLLFLVLFFYEANSQTTSIVIRNGANLFIDSGAILSIDNLVLKPTADLNIVSPNALTRDTLVTYFTLNPYINRVYTWENTIPFTGDITIYYLDSELDGLTESLLTLNVHNGLAWTAYPANVTRDEVNNFVLTTSLTNLTLKELTLASLTKPLPLHWIKVDASELGAFNKVEWTTEDEIGVKEFQVQKSSDAQSWTTFGNPVPARNTPGPNNYFFIDSSRFEPVSFYRIIERDLDGKKAISKTVHVRVKEQRIKLYPNPATDFIIAEIKGAPIQKVDVYDSKGSLVYSMKASNNSHRIPLTNIASGIYRIVILINNEPISIPFLKN